MRILIILFICACIILSCSTAKSNRVDLDNDVVNDTELSAKDMRTMVQKMAEDILQVDQIKDRIKKERTC